MKLVVGLGNPGEKYANTRHNAGFWVIDALAERAGIHCSKQKWQSLIGEGRIGGELVLFCKPQTYMNLSGEAVREICHFYTDLHLAEDLIVVYDDMDLPTGTLRLRQQGSAGGHNGMKSIITELGTERFPRVRLGIGRPEPGRDVISHVLQPFPSAERPVVDDMVARAADAVEFALQHSFTLAMNRFNQPRSPN
ncbi:MAG: aminoacyl-tRNA hydrolase [Alicyclobacillus sp.]|nr:aminoacyl-tRNA hydrolase [Alicyclobacillus sp.]